MLVIHLQNIKNLFGRAFEIELLDPINFWAALMWFLPLHSWFDTYKYTFQKSCIIFTSKAQIEVKKKKKKKPWSWKLSDLCILSQCFARGVGHLEIWLDNWQELFVKYLATISGSLLLFLRRIEHFSINIMPLRGNSCWNPIASVF